MRAYRTFSSDAYRTDTNPVQLARGRALVLALALEEGGLTPVRLRETVTDLGNVYRQESWTRPPVSRRVYRHEYAVLVPDLVTDTDADAALARAAWPAATLGRLLWALAGNAYCALGARPEPFGTLDPFAWAPTTKEDEPRLLRARALTAEMDEVNVPFTPPPPVREQGACPCGAPGPAPRAFPGARGRWALWFRCKACGRYFDRDGFAV